MFWLFWFTALVYCCKKRDHISYILSLVYSQSNVTSIGLYSNNLLESVISNNVLGMSSVIKHGVDLIYDGCILYRFFFQTEKNRDAMKKQWNRQILPGLRTQRFFKFTLNLTKCVLNKIIQWQLKALGTNKCKPMAKNP